MSDEYRALADENDEVFSPDLLPPSHAGSDQYEPLASEEMDLESGPSTQPFLTASDRFPPARKYKDIPFLAGFVAHLVIGLILFIKEGIQVYNCHCLGRPAITWFFIICGLCVLSIVTGCAILYAVHHFMKVFVVAVMIASCFIPLIIASAAIASGNSGASIPAVAASTLAFVFLTIMRPRLDFATALLSVVVTSLRDNKPLLVLAIAAIIPQAVWTLLMGVTLYATILTRSREPLAISVLQVVYLIMSVFWTFQVVRNIVHVTAAGTVSMWFFYTNSARPASPTMQAFQRASSSALGSICFGSLLIALVQTARFIVQQTRRQHRYHTLARMAIAVSTFLEGILVSPPVGLL